MRLVLNNYDYIAIISRILETCVHEFGVQSASITFQIPNNHEESIKSFLEYIKSRDGEKNYNIWYQNLGLNYFVIYLALVNDDSKNIILITSKILLAYPNKQQIKN